MSTSILSNTAFKVQVVGKRVNHGGWAEIPLYIILFFSSEILVILLDEKSSAVKNEAYKY